MINFFGNPIRCGCGAAGSFLVGTWLSLVEHSLGVRGVGSSNLPVPTIQLPLDDRRSSLALSANQEEYFDPECLSPTIVESCAWVTRAAALLSSSSFQDAVER